MSNTLNKVHALQNGFHVFAGLMSGGANRGA